MGQVYQAIRADDEYRKIVAIKVVRLGMDTEFFLHRFRQERQILANLDHPNIARLLDGGTTETGLPYFVIEYIEGQDLTEYCDTRQLSITDRLTLFLDICSAVQHAHRNLIVHRDIKPGNILVTRDGVPKLLDFGIAKVLNPDVSSQTGEVTVTGLHLMTPDYASPEQARLESVTTATDVYLLGALLYELLTGHRPHRFKNYQPQEVLHAICDVDPERPSTVVTRTIDMPRPAGTTGKTVTPESVSRGREGSVERLKKRLSGDLDTIVLMAMRKEPRLRYQSVERFADDIRRHLRREPVIARSPTVGYRAGKFVSRNKAKLAALAFMVLAVIAGVGATIREARIARSERLRADRRFNDVRHLANSFLFEFHDAIESLPGSTRARTLVVTKALEYLDLLAAESGDDPGLHRELATAYQKVGDLQGRPDTPNLGDTAGAMRSQQKAMAIRERLVERMPGDAEVLGELATSHDRMGELLLETGDVSAALTRFRSTLALREKLLKEDPTSEPARGGLSGSHSRIGYALSALGDSKGAREHFGTALEIAHAVSSANPGDLGAQQDLSVCYQRLGETQAAAGDTAGALLTYGRMLSIRERIAAAHPTNARLQRLLSVAYEKMGDARDMSGDKRGALELYRKELEIDRSLAAGDPMNTLARRDLAFSHTKVGEMQRALGMPQEALQSYYRALEIREQLGKEDATSLKVRRDLTISYERIGDLLLEQGHPEESLKYQMAGLDVRVKLSEEHPEDALTKFVLAVALSKLGDIHSVLGARAQDSAGERAEHWRQARDWYENCLDVLIQMRDNNTLSPSQAGAPDEIRGEIAKCDKAIAALAAARPQS